MIEEDVQQLDDDVQIVQKKRTSILPLLLLLVILGIIFFTSVASYVWLENQPTSADWSNLSITVEEGETVQEIAQKFENLGLVKSADLLYVILATQFDATKIKASTYVFSEPQTTFQIAERLIDGDFDSNLLQITIIEGESRHKIAERLDNEFDFFDTEEFLFLTEGMEGTLFPETYFIPAKYTTAQFVTLLHDTFHEVIEEYADAIAVNKYSEDEIITLASIVEREANTEESMKYVAGIFFNRLEIGMALQADATIEYVLDEGLNELPPGQLAENLRELDTPYNTYLYPGLPPSPIGNPGRTAIEAVLLPQESEYFYYLTGDDGEFYYSETYNQHLQNIDTYLR